MTTKAIVKAELLVWARERAKVTAEAAAKAVNVKPETLAEWEAGAEAPTLNQLRALATCYRFPLAVFYLPKPPKDFAPLRDFRRLPDADSEEISPNLAYHIRSAYERRELALELHEGLGEAAASFRIRASLAANPEELGKTVRDFLGVTVDDQKQAARKSRIFDFWRRRLEEKGILVFVISGPHYGVELDEMRGFAIAKSPLPVIVINGKDSSQGGRSFTLLHELVHILLGESALSNGNGDIGTRAEERRIERFCDAVAAATLMPRDLVLSFPEVQPAGERKWKDEVLSRIAQTIGVSRQALLIRFVTLHRATWDFYRVKADQFDEERRAAAEREEKKSVPIKRPVMLMSWNGRSFTGLVLRSYYDQRITLNDVSSYLGAKLKHIPDLERAVFQGAEP